MDMKVKLVELLDNFHRDLSPFTGNEKLFVVDDNIEQAEYLISNGVTVQEWISVKDRLPKGGEIVLCNTKYFFEVLQWDERADMWVDQYNSYRKNYVTHWQYLPQPPKGE